jgi:hypothetical protein
MNSDAIIDLIAALYVQVRTLLRHDRDGRRGRIGPLNLLHWIDLAPVV